ncbi:MAG: sugar phosphate isomerase/epimerase [SAR202 cluster bacterium]|nr:sugar phosphate isomerase/epimerase [SAR202 cluster bacterium]
MLKLSMQIRQLPDKPLEPQIEQARELGLDTIDIHVGGLPRDPETALKYKKMCLKAGLPIGYLGSGGGYDGAPEEFRKGIERDKADVDSAVFLGAPMIRLMSGRPKLDDPNPEKTWAQMVSGFSEVADYALDKGIFLGIQNHPPPAAPRSSDILRMLLDVNRPNMTHILDSGQWWNSIGAHPRGVAKEPKVDIYEFMEQTAPYASSVRIKVFKIDSGREEWLDYDRILKILKRVNYNGSLCICVENQVKTMTEQDALRLAVKQLRELMAKY